MAVRLATGQMTVLNVNDGKQGNPGKDAAVVTISPASLAFNAVTDSSGNCKASTSSGNTAQVAVSQGGKDVRASCKFFISATQNCTASISSSGLVTISAIATDTVNGRLISKTSASVVVRVAYNNTNYYVSLPVAVSVSAMWGGLKSDMSNLQSQYTSLTNDLKGSNPTVLAKYTSTIKQTARDISLEVSQKTVGRRNLLVGSDLRSQHGGFLIVLNGNLGDSGIHALGGIDGTNYLQCVSYKAKDTGDQYSGLFFECRGGKGENIKIQRGKKYTFSCWVKCNSTDAVIALEMIYKESKAGSSRLSRPPSSTHSFNVAKANVWQLIQCTYDLTDAQYDYVAANVWVYIGKDGNSATACFCRPMLEEGDTYNGWTLSEGDMDYVGGNLLDNTRTLTKMGNLDYANGVTQNAYNGSCAVAHVTAPSTGDSEIARWLMSSVGLVKGQDYVFSFLAKGSGRITAFMYDNSPKLNLEGSDGQSGKESGDGACLFYLSSEWRRYWVHWHILDTSNLPRYVLLRAMKGSDVYATQPKLEEGAAMTEWTERKTDVIDKATAKAAGMEITSSGVTLYGDKILVKNGNATAALFTGGKLNATLIDADKIEVKHLWAKSEDGNTKVGYFGNYEVDEAKDDNDVLYPLWVGAGEAKDAPFRVSEKGHLITTSATLGTWTLKAGLLEYDTGYEGADPGMALTNNNLIFREYTSHTHVRKRMVWIGDYTPSGNIPIIQSNIWIEDKFSAEYHNEIKTGLRVSIEGCNDSLQYSDANYNGEKGSAVFGNFAIYAEKGMYAGLRPMSRTISRSCAITDMDFFIHVDGGSGQTFALPASPQRGQMYWFLHSQAGNFKINGNGKNLYAPAAGNPIGTLTFNTPGELLIVWFDGNIWRVVWTKGQWN